VAGGIENAGIPARKSPVEFLGTVEGSAGYGEVLDVFVSIIRALE